MTAPVLFVAADPRECKPWVRRWEDVRTPALPVHWARTGTWRGQEMAAIANGAGWERAAAAVQAVESPKAVYNIGFCGALDGKLAIGDVFVATEVRCGEVRRKALAPAGPPCASGALVS